MQLCESGSMQFGTDNAPKVMVFDKLPTRKGKG
jgi:hypothetical protein